MLDAPPQKAVLPVLTVVAVVILGFVGNPFFFGTDGALAGGGTGDGAGGDGGGGAGAAAPPGSAATNDVAGDSVDSAVDAAEDGEYVPIFDQPYRPAPEAPDDSGDTEPSRSLLDTDETLVFLWQSSVLELQYTGDSTVEMWQRSIEEGSVGATLDATEGTVDAGTGAADTVADDGEQVVDDTVDDGTDTVDDATGGATDDTTDTVDDTVDDTTDTVDDTVDDTEDTLDDTTGSLTGDDDGTATPTQDGGDDGGIDLF